MEKLTHNKGTYKSFSNTALKVLFFVLVIAVCIYLGLWQIDRANQKIKIYNDYINSLKKEPIIVKTFTNKYQEFTRLKVYGQFIIDKQFLLDNSIANRRAGYKVLTPYKVEKKTILVDRGWVENHFDQKVPDIKIKTPNTYINAYIFHQKNLPQLDETIYDDDWPKIIQNIEIKEISILLKSELEPYILVMNENQDNSYIDNRRFKKNSELKHYMYAGQWFLFSIVAFIFMIILLRRDTNKDEKTK